MEFGLGELFCGPGGIALGALNSKSDDNRYRVSYVWANDYDADTYETYRKDICRTIQCQYITPTIENRD